MRRISVLALFALVTFGCDSKKPVEPTPADASSPVPSTAALASAMVADDAGAVANGDAGAVDSGLTIGDMLGLGPRLAAEEKTRTGAGVRAEDVLAMAKDAGATFDAPKQHLGSVWKALYCTAAVNPVEDFAIDVCEFRDEKTAKEGEATSKKGFGATPGREVHRNGTTMLTLLVGKPTPPNVALAKKIAEGFAKMKAKPAK